MARTDIFDRRVEIETWIEADKPKAYMCTALRCRPSTLQLYLNKLGIVYAGNPGRRGVDRGSKRELNYYLVKDGPFINSHALKVRMLREGRRTRRCQRCRRVRWMMHTIPLELHHTDGDRTNNEDTNLEIICPNCHALTDNNSGRANLRRSGE